MAIAAGGIGQKGAITLEKKVLYKHQPLILTRFWATGEVCLWITDPQQIAMAKMELVGGYPNEYSGCRQKRISALSSLSKILTTV